MASKILQIEADMAIQKVMARKALLNSYIEEIFMEISGRKQWINLQDLTNFLEYFDFYPTASDLEAILRRCDHDADRRLCLEEFKELLQVEVVAVTPECKTCLV